MVTKYKNGNANKLEPHDRAFHDWYRFVLSFPPHLVQDYIKSFGLDEHSMLLDPFCGTGTTLIESKLRRIPCAGIEANPFASFASSVKIDWSVDPGLLMRCSQEIADIARGLFQAQGINDDNPFEGNVSDLPLQKLSIEENRLILGDSISPLPLHKVLTLLNVLRRFQYEETYKHQILALANTLVVTASNLRFGPEVGVGEIKADVPIISSWLLEIQKMAEDLRSVAGNQYSLTQNFLADSRFVSNILPSNSIDAVITSPPYPNEKDYTRITRLESVILGFISTRSELQLMKKGLLRSNTRNVYKGDDDDLWIAAHPGIQRIAKEIEDRRIELGKTSGFERLYGRVTKLYFGGMARHLESLRTILRPNAQLAYVVGDQASYLRVMIHTGQLLAEIAQALGYELVRIDLFRTRLATATKQQLREEVVILRYGGK